MNFLKKVFLLWCWTTCNSINQIESQYNSMWQQQQQQQQQRYLPQQQYQHQQQLPPNQRQQRALIKISASGFLPFENDVLPYAVLQRMLNENQQQQHHQRRHQQQQQQQYSTTYDYNRGGRYIQWQTGPQPKNLLEYAKRVQRPKVRATIRNLNRNQAVNSFTKAQPGAQYYYKNPKWLKKSSKLKLQQTSTNSKHYKLYDADGEYLLDLRYHNNDRDGSGDERKATAAAATRLLVDNEPSADTKTAQEIVASSDIGMGANSNFDEDVEAKRVVQNDSGNNTLWKMSAPTALSKTMPIVVEDLKLKPSTMMMPTSPVASTSTMSNQKRVEHIWLRLK